MRRLRALIAIPFVAALLLVGTTGALAQTSPGIPGIPGLPGTPGAPFVAFGFPCQGPQIEDVGGIGGLTTTDSFVILWPQSQPGASLFGQSMDFSFMKCFFHYSHGAVEGAPYTEKGFPCVFQNEDVSHMFAHSIIVVRDTFAIEICTGTSVVKQNQTITFTSTPPEAGFVGGPTYTPTATATSGLPVALTIDGTSSSTCVISNAGVVSFTGQGTCTIDANQAGNATFNPAPQVQQSIPVINPCNVELCFT